MNEQEKLLAEIEVKDVLEQPIEPEKDEAVTEEKDEEKLEDSELRNRRERRLAARLQAERESSMQLAARLEALSEVNKFKRDTPQDDYLSSVERIYGTNTPEASAATDLLKKALSGVKDEAKREALEVFREEQKATKQAEKKAEQEIDDMLEELEDEYSIDLTSSNAKPLRDKFLQSLEKISPKDEDGNIIAYADHHAVWDSFKARPTRAKEVAARSMSRGSGSPSSTVEQDATTRYLQEEGII